MHAGGVVLDCSAHDKRTLGLAGKGIDFVGKLVEILGAKIHFFHLAQVNDLGEGWVKLRIRSQQVGVSAEILGGQFVSEFDHYATATHIDDVLGGELKVMKATGGRGLLRGKWVFAGQNQTSGKWSSWLYPGKSRFLDCAKCPKPGTLAALEMTDQSPLSLRKGLSAHAGETSRKEELHAGMEIPG